jgi:flagella basal body P-ring formation protein FlgA
VKYLLFLLLASPAVIPARCLPVTGDRILGADLASADTKFASLPATLQFGYAPAPGASRVFTAVELQRLAHANGIEAAGFADICFEIPVHVPTDSEFVDAMRPALPADATLRLVDMAHAAIPAGKVQFPLSGLEPPAMGNPGMAGAQLWRGFIQYTDTRRIAVWARVVVTATYTTVITRNAVVADTPVDAASLEVQTKTGPLKRDATASRVDQVAGRVIRRPLPAGAEIPLSLIDEAPVIRRGDQVRVEVRSGLAILHFEAVAESNVRAGEYATFRNPTTGKTFRALAETGSKALIVVGKGSTL